jgi:mono/diheme cytochrome c family protein
MKKAFIVAGLIMTALVFAGALNQPVSSVPGVFGEAGDTALIPAEISAIFSNSCLGCHGEAGKAMALSHLKIARWGEYTPEKQVQKAAEICKEVSGGSMPPKSFLRDNPDKAPSREQIDALCNWSAQLQKGK